jgi:hypothetical protein
MTTPKQIDDYLKAKGSPLAGQGSVFVGAGKKYGVDPGLVVAISGIESSFGKHILGNFNAWGWGPGRAFSSWQEGISRVTQGLSQGYIRQGLTTPEAIVRKYAPASDGNDEKRWASTVSQFLAEMGGGGYAPAPAAASSGGGTTSLLDGTDPMAAIARDNLAEIAKHGKVDAEHQLAKLTQGVAEATEKQSLAAQASNVPQSPKATVTKPGPTNGLRLPTQWSGTHITDGLDWNHGKKTAIDILGKPGTAVIVPFNGVVEKWGSAQGGEAMYLRDSNGRRYWLGHIEDRIPAGVSFAAGTQIATISPHHATPHVHWDEMD